MERDIEVLASQFRNEAASLFRLVFEQFERSVQKLNRQHDENVFQQMKGHHAQKLKEQLQQVAEKTLDRLQGYVSKNTLRLELTRQVAYYVLELHLKIDAM